METEIDVQDPVQSIRLRSRFLADLKTGLHDQPWKDGIGTKFPDSAQRDAKELSARELVSNASHGFRSA